jgi:carboxyl-terminal processing protease
MPKRNLAWILVIAMITLLMWQLPQTIAGRDAVYKAFGPLADVRAQIRKRYVDEVDDTEMTGAAVRAGIHAMVERLNDPYAVYFNQAEYERFKKRADGVFGGIGVDVWAAPEGLEIINRAPKSPASERLQPGDIIAHIDGLANRLSIVTIQLIERSAGLRSRSLIRRCGSGYPREVTLQQATLDLDPVRGWARTLGRLAVHAGSKSLVLRLTKLPTM